MITPTNIEQRKQHIQHAIALYQTELDLLDRLKNLYKDPAYIEVKELEHVKVPLVHHISTVVPVELSPEGAEALSKTLDSTHAAIQAIKDYCSVPPQTYKSTVKLTPDLFPVSTGTFYRAINIMVSKQRLVKTGLAATYVYHPRKD